MTMTSVNQGGARLIMAARCLALDQLTVLTSNLLAGVGISALLLKGPATSSRLYGDKADGRNYSDVDLLVAPGDFDAAQRVLSASGYHQRTIGPREREMLWHERAWRAPDLDLTVDLHRSFAGVADAAAFFTALWRGREHLELSGDRVAVPGPAAAALILALHAAAPGKTRRPLDDLRAASEVFDLGVWAAAVKLARAVGAESACRAGIELLPQGAELAARLGTTAPVSTSHWLAARRFPGISVNLAMAMDLPGLRKKTEFVLRRVVPTPAFIRLSDGSFGGTGLPGLAVAYLNRWMRILRAGPGSIRDLQRARRGLDQGTRRLVGGLRKPRPAMFGAASCFAWSWIAARSVHTQLATIMIDDVELGAPPAAGSAAARAVGLVLRLRQATCLEQALVRQRFEASAGRDRILIVGVSKPAKGFRAHAWLAGDPGSDPDFSEIWRRAAPGRWLDPTRPQTRIRSQPHQGRPIYWRNSA